MQRFQATLEKAVSVAGHGVHSAKPCALHIRPAPVDHGIIFVRKDKNGIRHFFPAKTEFSGPTDLCTTLGSGDIRLETIEHLMAAISAAGLDNLEIEAESNELPILDGSAAVFISAFDEAGVILQSAARRYIRVLEPVRVEAGEGFAEFLPDETMRFDIKIAFSSLAIGEQEIAFDLTPDFFARELASARTFGFLKDAERLRAMGLALGSSLDNSLVIGLEDEILNEDGKRFEDEFVRHKALDAIGDTALLGYPFLGLFRSYKGGHTLNAQAVKALLKGESAYEITEK